MRVGARVAKLAPAGAPALDTLDVADTLDLSPSVHADKFDQASFTAAAPEAPLHAFDVTICDVTQAGVDPEYVHLCRLRLS